MKFGSLLIVAAVALLGVAGYLYLEESSAGVSPIKLEFEDLQSLRQLKNGVENRVELTVINPTKRPARIVGNNAC